VSKSRIREFVLERFPLAKARGLEDGSQLLEEGILDSLGVLELVNFLQDEMGVPVEDEDLVPENFASVDAIFAFVEAKVAARGTAR
jgi:acyl carrier protein